MVKLVALLTSLAVSLTAIANPSQLPITPYKATFNILHKGDPVGKGYRELTLLDDGRIEYSYYTDLKWMIFSQKRKETSYVKLHNYQLELNEYTFERSGTGKDKTYRWQFFPNQNKALNLVKKTEFDIDFSEGLQDKLSYHLQQRLSFLEQPEQSSFNYDVITTSGKIKNYRYEYVGVEELMLPYGLIKALKYKREVADKERVTYAWFAPELDYLMVRLYQIKDGVDQFEAQLDKLDLKQ
ncbi:DUF3108 domain-containing protein [Thalassotalea sp. LPB0316]|uniref:DUF3108 domain-containing protein n=1 Tax=Thalassotalea sp. LPB0316 TaxID=2769490 RepID=UPI001866968C|nr:DUF3108 domain-containing protein [Thalassotalea sp. LPB0316]QOL25194.1 DUF3108 domain-containing protein [Thalassotalea sp. LPB0316]